MVSLSALLFTLQENLHLNFWIKNQWSDITKDKWGTDADGRSAEATFKYADKAFISDGFFDTTP